MIPGSGPENIDMTCNAWDYVRWIFVLWTFFAPMICLILWLLIKLPIYFVVITFFMGIIFFIIAHRTLKRSGNYKLVQHTSIEFNFPSTRPNIQ